MKHDVPFQRYVVFLLLCACMADGNAQETKDSTFGSYTIHVVEVRADRTDLPYPISTIEAEEIQMNPALTLEPLLETVPGIWMQSGAPNTNRISIRGVGNRQPFATSKLKVYLGEIPLTNGVGESSIEDIDPGLFNDIEIWRSPSSALWGSGLGGMIHLSPQWDGAEKLQFTASTGSFGLLNLRAIGRIAHDTAGHHTSVIHFQRAAQDGYRENNRYRKTSGTLMQRARFGKKLDVYFFGHLIGLKAEIPSSLSRTDFRERPHQAAANWVAVNGREDYAKGIAGLHFRYLMQNGWTCQGSIFGQFVPSTEIRPFNILDSRNHTIGTRQRLNAAISASTLLSFGMEYTHEVYDWETFEVGDRGEKGALLVDDEEARDQYYLFGHFETELLERLRLIMGISYSVLDQVQGDLEFQQNAFNPSIGLDYALPGKDISIFTSVSRGFSPIPLLDALDSDGRLNASLKPETGWSVELGARFRTPDKKLDITLTAYRMRIRNLFVQERISEDRFVGANAGRTKHDGLELQGSWRPANNLQFNTTYAYSHHRFGEFIDGNADHSGNALTGTAPHMMRNRVAWHVFPTAAINFTHRYISQVPVNDANTVYGEAFHRFDISLETEVPTGSQAKILLQLGLNNVFDVRYASMYQVNAVSFGSAEPRYYYPGLPRHFYATIRWTLR